MTETTVAVITLLILGWAVVSGAMARHNVTGPLLFAVAGYILSNPDWGPLAIDIDTASIHLLAEVTLALVLFSDAARVNLDELRRDVSLPVRLLGIGLPLTLILGGLLASWLFADMTWALAMFIGAALAPTDAALSVQVINDGRVPMRLRRGLNVESGLNDGIATPIVSFALALAASQLGIDAESDVAVTGDALVDLALGVGTGLAIGIGSAIAINLATERQWMTAGGRLLATLSTAVGAFTVALAIDGNGFIAAFLAGIAFGAMLRDDEAALERDVELPELGGELLALVVWFLFGATLVPIAFDNFSAAVIVYAVLSLTVIRMVPVAIAMYRSGLDRKSVAFLAWFGPRGLASVVFALLAIEGLGDAADEAVAVVTMTVMLSVLLHGVTAGPAGRQYAHSDAPASEAAEGPRARPSSFRLRHHRG